MEELVAIRRVPEFERFCNDIHDIAVCHPRARQFLETYELYQELKVYSIAFVRRGQDHYESCDIINSGPNCDCDFLTITYRKLVKQLKDLYPPPSYFPLVEGEDTDEE